MRRDFVEQVTSASWRSAAKEWIRHRLAEHALVAHEIEQRRVRPWSTGLVARTDEGPMYFKAGCPSMAFEPTVHARLAELEPHKVDAPLALDAARGWLLTRGRAAAARVGRRGAAPSPTRRRADRRGAGLTDEAQG